MTLNAVTALNLRFPPNMTDFQADYFTVVEDTPIMSIKYCLPVSVFHFWRNLQHIYQYKLDWWGRPLLRVNLADTDPPADFLSIFARSALAVTTIEKRSINTKSHPKGGSKTQSVQILNNKPR